MIPASRRRSPRRVGGPRQAAKLRGNHPRNVAPTPPRSRRPAHGATMSCRRNHLLWAAPAVMPGVGGLAGKPAHSSARLPSRSHHALAVFSSPAQPAGLRPQQSGPPSDWGAEMRHNYQQSLTLLSPRSRCHQLHGEAAQAGYRCVHASARLFGQRLRTYAAKRTQNRPAAK